MLLLLDTDFVAQPFAGQGVLIQEEGSDGEKHEGRAGMITSVGEGPHFYCVV